MYITKALQTRLKSNLGLICLISAQLCICINIVANKYLIQHNPALVLLTLRFIIGACLLYGFLHYKYKNPELKQKFTNLCRRSKLSIIAQGLLGGFLFNILMLAGLQMTTATMAGILSSLVPTLIIIFSYFILKEKTSKNELLSILIATIGIIFININKLSGSGISLHIIGDLLIILALFPEALYTIVAKLQPVDLCPITSSTVVNIINALAFCTTLIFFPGNIYSINNISMFDWLLIISLLATAGFMFFVFWTIGLKHSSTQQAGIVTAVVPVGSCLMAVLFLHEQIHIYEIIGITMVISSIYLGTSNKPIKNKKTQKTQKINLNNSIPFESPNN